MEGKPWLQTEASPEEPGNTVPSCGNSELDMDKCCINVNSPSRDPSHPQLAPASKSRTRLHASFQLPPRPGRPAARFPTRTLGGRPLHLCDICCSAHSKVPARFSGVLG